ncbi:alpha-1,3-arabinosyltransferase XAT3-like [Lolium rigidum]|uniref:alpha-1,3-arabinosyltransferase XAT3-like n=1 Tax=Lolium rigidum TaxID=89674 RepID=UPI001F5C72C6|nr:alpha-1,3-arabinosyltransferase XAT3-like [Lolium rigidum]
MKTRSSARGEPRRLGNMGLLALMLCSLVALSLIRARFAPIGSTTGAEPVIKAEDPKPAAVVSQAAVATDAGDNDVPDEVAAVAVEESKVGEDKQVEEVQPKPEHAAAIVVDASKPVCYETSRRSDTCEAAGDVRLLGRSQTIYVDTLEQEWKTRPYCRKHDAYALSHVKEWSLKPHPSGDGDGDGGGAAPRCTTNSSATAFVLSTGGFTGNPFHDYTDVLIPAFITAHRFGGEVQFLVSSYKSWWMNRYIQIFQQMSRHEVLDIDADDEVRCYPSVVVGPTFHKELGVDASKAPDGVSTADFRKMLRSAFGLERATATPSGDRWDIRRRPRLLIITRRASRGRAFMNERAMADMAGSLGFDVRLGDPEMSSDTSKFARLVNSCDVMVGVHGAGLTNMVFLPAGAVVVQVVPFGRLEWLARNTFAEPSAGMEVHYLEYVVQLDETTLSEQYPSDHPVLKDPMAIHKQGWDALKTTYLDKQNVRPHLGRLKNTFLQALKMLPHGRDD